MEFPIYLEHIIGLVPELQGGFGLRMFRKMGFRSKNGVFDRELNATFLSSYNDKLELDLQSFIDEVMASYLDFASSSILKEPEKFKVVGEVSNMESHIPLNTGSFSSMEECSSLKNACFVEAGHLSEEKSVCGVAMNLSGLEKAPVKDGNVEDLDSKDHCSLELEEGEISTFPDSTTVNLHSEELISSPMAVLNSVNDAVMGHDYNIVNPKAYNLFGLNVEDKSS